MLICSQPYDKKSKSLFDFNSHPNTLKKDFKVKFFESFKILH